MYFPSMKETNRRGRPVSTQFNTWREPESRRQSVFNRLSISSRVSIASLSASALPSNVLVTETVEISRSPASPDEPTHGFSADITAKDFEPQLAHSLDTSSESEEMEAEPRTATDLPPEAREPHEGAIRRRRNWSDLLSSLKTKFRRSDRSARSSIFRRGDRSAESTNDTHLRGTTRDHTPELSEAAANIDLAVAVPDSLRLPQPNVFSVFNVEWSTTSRLNKSGEDDVAEQCAKAGSLGLRGGTGAWYKIASQPSKITRRLSACFSSRRTKSSEAIEQPSGQSATQPDEHSNMPEPEPESMVHMLTQDQLLAVTTTDSIADTANGLGITNVENITALAGIAAEDSANDTNISNASDTTTLADINAEDSANDADISNASDNTSATDVNDTQVTNPVPQTLVDNALETSANVHSPLNDDIDTLVVKDMAYYRTKAQQMWQASGMSSSCLPEVNNDEDWGYRGQDVSIVVPAQGSSSNATEMVMPTLDHAPAAKAIHGTIQVVRSTTNPNF